MKRHVADTNKQTPAGRDTTQRQSRDLLKFIYIDFYLLQTCHHWHRVALDEFIWKALFARWWKVEKRALNLAPGKSSWLSEFKRLYYHTPLVECEMLRKHRDQVLHVTFSHDGKLFSTCSKDGYVRVGVYLLLFLCVHIRPYCCKKQTTPHIFETCLMYDLE